VVVIARSVGAAAAALVLVAGACGGGGDGGPGEAGAAAADRDPTTTTDGGLVREDGGGSGTDLGTTSDDGRSDVSRQVSDTLSDLGAATVEGDTVITLPDEVLFDYDQSQLRPDAAATLDRIAQAIAYFQDAPVRVAGHTDSQGPDAYNQQLSEDRAQSVVDYLVGTGVDGGRITAEGFGESQPIAPNENADGSDNPDGRAQNRRVEIVLQGVDPADLGG
jgi:outer membrane protein OmpA-like peptidoglycan-associated protein